MKNATFKKAAREHQVNYREQNIGIDYKTYVTWLTDEAGKSGKNFFNGFSVFKAVNDRFEKFSVNLYSDMLRSEHIPFNFFVPFRQDLTFCKNVFNELLGGCIKSINEQSIIDNKENIKIEFAPSPKEAYLNDRTSFDAYIEYTHIDNTKGIICIEVKYTEKGYPLKPGSTEQLAISNSSSMYNSVSKECGLFDLKTKDLLVSNNFRQIWRNQLLAERILLKHNDMFKHSSSLIFYPEDNEYFTETSEHYNALLRENKNKFVPVTYEKFLAACKNHCPNSEYKAWIDYLTKRYIIRKG